MGSLLAVRALGPPSRDAIDRMVDAAPHRGPLSEVVSKGRCILAVTDHPGDLSESSVDAGDDLLVAFSGRLDNAGDLRKELDAADRPVDDSPAAIVGGLVRRDGDRAVERLRGAFAGAVTDGERLWCFRDHVGMRALFHRRDGNGAFVASEAKQVAAGAGIPRRPDVAALEAIFFRAVDDATPSAIAGVERLPKARVMLIDDAGARTRRYWSPEDLLESAPYTVDDVAERFPELMTQACERMMRGPDAISLSGGIDSPAIAAFAAPSHERMFGTPLIAFSTVYPEQPSVDESELIALVAERFGMPLHTYPRTARPIADLDRWVDLLDGPVPQILVSDTEEHYTRMRDLGPTNLLTGEVAEFLFDLRGPLIPHLLHHGRVGPAIDHLWKQRRDHGVGWPAIARQVGAGLLPSPIARAAARRDARVPVGTTPSWIDVERATAPVVRAARPGWERWRTLQLGGFVGPGLTMEADEIVQQVCGVRTRRPFADVDLWEFFLSLRAEVKFPDTHGKGLMRNLLRGRVPDEIVDKRAKTVFDESLLARMELPQLSSWLARGTFRLPGVDYGSLAARIDAGDLTVHEYIRAKDLAAIHAFVDVCER